MAGSALALASAGMIASMAGGTASATGTASQAVVGGTDTRARLVPLNNSGLFGLNNSGLFGVATVNVDGQDLDVSVNARRLLRGMPHAQHIHFGAQATNECPDVARDENKDHRLNTAEGLPDYGPVRVSLTTRGATGPGSTLAVTRFPTADNGRFDYDRQTRTKWVIAEDAAAGDAVVVIHGIDYNHNGKYDFRGAGKSELDPANSAPGLAGYATLAARLDDAWVATNGAEAGSTCCQLPSLANPVPQLDERSDLVMTTDDVTATASHRTGTTPVDLPGDTWWASDHAGVVARLVVGGAS